MEGIMDKLLSIAAITAFSLSGAVAEGCELPSYEVMGFPITPHQFSVLGSANIKEQSPNPSLTMAGMPASPHQVVVLTPRPRVIEELAAATPIVETSFSTR
jgi:hypothetical protein